MGDAGGAAHQDAIALGLVRVVDDVKQLRHVVGGLFQRPGHHHGHDGGLPILGHQGLVAGLVVVLGDGYDAGAEGGDAGEDGFHGFPEGVVVHGQGVRLDDDDFGDGFRAAAQAGFQQFGGALGVNAAAQAQFGGGCAGQQLRVDAEGNDHQNHPKGNDHQRPAGADAGQRFGHVESSYDWIIAYFNTSLRLTKKDGGASCEQSVCYDWRGFPPPSIDLKEQPEGAAPMHAEQRRVADDGLHYLAIFPDDYDAEADYPLVVMLHGFGANMQDLAGLAPSINRKGYVYVCPNAPIPFELAPGMVGYGWHPPRGQATEEHFEQAEALLDAFFAEALAEFRAGDGRAVLLGFSQGGGMTYRMGLGRPDRFAALVALSASLPDPEVLRPRLPDHREQPVFVAHGLHDQMVSMDSARRTREFLDAENYNLSYHEYNMGHEIPVEVLRDMVPWVEAILPPLVEETDRIF